MLPRGVYERFWHVRRRGGDCELVAQSGDLLSICQHQPSQLTLCLIAPLDLSA